MSYFHNDFFGTIVYNNNIKRLTGLQFMDLLDAIITRINELALQHNTTIPKWSIRAGITPSTIYGIMKKTSGYPRITTLKLLCDAIGITLADFFNADYIDTAFYEEN